MRAMMTAFVFILMGYAIALLMRSSICGVIICASSMCCGFALASTEWSLCMEEIPLFKKRIYNPSEENVRRFNERRLMETRAIVLVAMSWTAGVATFASDAWYIFFGLGPSASHERVILTRYNELLFESSLA